MNSIMRNKTSESAVLVVDDHSSDYTPTWFRQKWNVAVFIPPNKQPIGFCFKIALERFLLSRAEFWISFPNDCILANGFDRRILEILNHGSAIPRSVSVCYRSVCHAVEFIPGNDLYGLSKVTGGVGMCMSRRTALWFAGMMENKWGWLYDFEMSKHFVQIRVPIRSLAEHTGAHQADALHPNSYDVAVEFVGENQ